MQKSSSSVNGPPKGEARRTPARREAGKHNSRNPEVSPSRPTRSSDTVGGNVSDVKLPSHQSVANATEAAQASADPTYDCLDLRHTAKKMAVKNDWRTPKKNFGASKNILRAKHTEETRARSSDSIDTLFRCLCKDSKVFDGSIKEMV